MYASSFSLSFKVRFVPVLSRHIIPMTRPLIVSRFTYSTSPRLVHRHFCTGSVPELRVEPKLPSSELRVEPKLPPKTRLQAPLPWFFLRLISVVFVLLVMAYLAYWYYWYWRLQTLKNAYRNMFSGLSNPPPSRVVNRNQEKLTLSQNIRDQPGSIICIVGPMNAGKTTLIQEVLRDIEMVANSNIRDWSKDPEQPALVKELTSFVLSAFKIKSLSEELDKIKPQINLDWGIWLVGRLFPSVSIPKVIDVDSLVYLKSCFDYIEDVLQCEETTASNIPGNGKNRQKPVFFVDEFSRLAPLLLSHDPRSKAAVIMFFSWLVKMSKDKKQMHVILCSSDYFASQQLLSLIDPNYIDFISVDDIVEKEEIKLIWAEIKQQYPTQHNYKNEDKIISLFGGRMAHLIGYARGGESFLQQKYAQERARLLLKVNHVPFPQNLWSKKDEDFCNVLDALLNAEHHILSVDDLVVKTGVSQSYIENLSKDDYLCILPGLSDSYLRAPWQGQLPVGFVVKVTNPLFLKCWKDYKENKIEPL